MNAKLFSFIRFFGEAALEAATGEINSREFLKCKKKRGKEIFFRFACFFRGTGTIPFSEIVSESFSSSFEAFMPMTRGLRNECPGASITRGTF